MTLHLRLPENASSGRKTPRATRKPHSPKGKHMAKTDLTTNPADPSQLPAYLAGMAPVSNTDNFDASDVVLPRVKLLQGLSSEIDTFDEAKAGQFWHTGLDVSLGTEVRFIVADRRKKYLLMAPIADGQGILARSDDFITWDRTGSWNIKLKHVKEPVKWEIKDLDVAASGLAEWGTSNPSDEDSPPAATIFYDYLVLLPDYMEYGPAILSLARSQIRKAKKGLNDKIKLHADMGRPMQSCMFTMSVVEDSADGQDFKNYLFKSAGFVQEEALFKHALEYRGALANIKIQDEGRTESDDVAPKDSGEGNY
jgi:hypothetical protein